MIKKGMTKTVFTGKQNIIVKIARVGLIGSDCFYGSGNYIYIHNSHLV